MDLGFFDSPLSLAESPWRLWVIDDIDCWVRAFRARFANDDFDGTVRRTVETSDGGLGRGIAASCVGVREPLGEAVGGGSDDSKRCRAVSDGEGLTCGGGTCSIC